MTHRAYGGRSSEPSSSQLDGTPAGQTRQNVTNPFTQTNAISNYRPDDYSQSKEYGHPQGSGGQVGDSYAYTLSQPMPNYPTTGEFGAQHYQNQQQHNPNARQGPYQETSDSYSSGEDDDSESSALDDYGESGSSESSFTDYEPSKR